MASIPVSEARGLFTKHVLEAYNERPQVTSFLRSFFPTKEYATKLVSIEVKRNGEPIAVDVNRNSEGNRNVFSKSTEKVIEPPYYREYHDITHLDLYDRVFGDGSGYVGDGVYTQFVEDVAEKNSMLQDKIERRLELQCAEVLTTGIVTVADGSNIDYKRKAGSLVDNSATPWSTGTVDPYAHFEAGGNFLRQVGKASGGNINAILGSSALNALLNNGVLQKRGPISNINLDSIRVPQRDSVGATLHGEISAGSYKVRLWSYPEFYDTANGTSTPYIDPKKVILLPEMPRFELSFGAVPQLVDEENSTITKGAFVWGKYVDQRRFSKVYDVRSAGVALPKAIDQIYTMQVLA